MIDETLRAGSKSLAFDAGKCLKSASIGHIWGDRPFSRGAIRSVFKLWDFVRDLFTIDRFKAFV
jgi:hypothetical protein